MPKLSLRSGGDTLRFIRRVSSFLIRVNGMEGRMQGRIEKRTKKEDAAEVVVEVGRGGRSCGNERDADRSPSAIIFLNESGERRPATINIGFNGKTRAQLKRAACK